MTIKLTDFPTIVDSDNVPGLYEQILALLQAIDDLQSQVTTLTSNVKPALYTWGTKPTANATNQGLIIRIKDPSVPEGAYICLTDSAGTAYAWKRFAQGDW